MANDPLAGRGDRAPERSRMLVATEDGIFLWPGSALLARCGNGFTLMEPREINSHLSTFFGSDGIYVPLQPILDNARDQMRVGQVASVQRSLDRLPLPPVSSNGARLMRAIARRQDLAVPDVVIAPAPSGTVWSDRDVENVAKLHDGAQNKAKELAKIFNPGSAWDPGKHPRWPPGQSDGGQFRPNDSGEGGSPLLPVADRKPWPSNGGPGLDDPPPKIPKVEPPKGRIANAIIKAMVQWLVRAASAGSDTVAPEVVLGVQVAVEAAKWAAPYIKSYFDGPKTLEELQAAAKNPQTGYEIHHIVEQTPAEKDGYPRSQIDGDDNLARIPTLKHWELNRWYEMRNENYGGVSPREYLKGKDWETRREVGLDGLRDVGVLKR